MCEPLYDLMKDEIDAREAKEVAAGEARGESKGETQGVNKLKEAIIAIKEGVKPAVIAEKYGREVFEAADSVIKSIG